MFRTKLLAACTALCLLAAPVFSAAPAAAQLAICAHAADSGNCGEQVTWRYDRSTATMYITGTGAMSDDWEDRKTSSFSDSLEKLVVESGVTSIGRYAFTGCEHLTTVILPEGLKTINDDAFSGCTSLSSVNIPDSVTSIGGYAFERCALSSVKISANVKTIGGAAFGMCPNLTSIDVAADNPYHYSVDGVLYSRLYKELSCYPGARKGPFTIPDGVKTIGLCAFRECEGLNAVTIPDSVTTIDSDAFAECKNLISVKGCGGLGTIEAGAFYGCTSLPDVVIPESVTRIEFGAFDRCSSMHSVTILNPTCYIAPAEDTFIDSVFGFTGILYGYEGSSAQSYAEEFSRRFKALPEPGDGLVGDVNGDETADSVDASLVLSYAAAVGAGGTPTLYDAQDDAAEQNARLLADVNADGKIDATDSAYILIYASIAGASGEADWNEILGIKKGLTLQ